MTSLAFDTRTPFHSQWLGLSNNAVALAFRALLWSHGPDAAARPGFLTLTQLQALSGGLGGHEVLETVAELVAAGSLPKGGILKRVDGGYIVSCESITSGQAEAVSRPLEQRVRNTKAEAGRLGGLRSAEARRAAMGTAQPPRATKQRPAKGFCSDQAADPASTEQRLAKGFCSEQAADPASIGVNAVLEGNHSEPESSAYWETAAAGDRCESPSECRRRSSSVSMNAAEAEQQRSSTLEQKISSAATNTIEAEQQSNRYAFSASASSPPLAAPGLSGSETATASQGTSKRNEANSSSLAALASRIVRDERVATHLKPEQWPEVLQVARYFAKTWSQELIIGSYARDSGVRAIVALFAAGCTVETLLRVADLSLLDPFFQERRRRSLAILSPEVVRQTLERAEDIQKHQSEAKRLLDLVRERRLTRSDAHGPGIRGAGRREPSPLGNILLENMRVA